MTIGQPDDDHAEECIRLAMMKKSVVSLPPCCVALEVKAPPTLPCSAPPIHKLPACSQKLPMAEGMRPNRVGAPTAIVVVAGEFSDRSRSARLFELEMRRPGDCFGNRLRNAFDIDRYASRARTFGNGVGHRLDVAVARIVRYEQALVIRVSSAGLLRLPDPRPESSSQ